MTNSKKIIEAMENIDESYIQEASGMRKSKHMMRFLVPAAMVAVMVVVGVTYKPQMNSNQSNELVQDGGLENSFTSPYEIRKFFNYNGLRYAYQANLIPEQYIQLDKELGEIKYDLTSNPEENAMEDYAGIFKEGSKIYSIMNTSTTFRLAVSDESGVYICQVTDTVDNEGLDLVQFFEEIGLIKNTEEIIVLDHVGENIITEFKKKDSQSLLELISSAKLAKLTDSDFQKLGEMQTIGKSFQLEAKLVDGTIYSFYLIPEMNLLMLGDNRYEISEEAKGFFDKLIPVS